MSKISLIGLQGTTQQKAAVELYARQLMRRAREQGKRLYVFPINVAYENRPGDIYHLVHVSQHPKARLVMESVLGRVKGPTSKSSCSSRRRSRAT